MVEWFFPVVGWYNLGGALVLLLLLAPARAEWVLGKLLQITRGPYDHGAHGALWIWWASATNVFLGLVTIRAAGWPDPARAARC